MRNLTSAACLVALLVPAALAAQDRQQIIINEERGPAQEGMVGFPGMPGRAPKTGTARIRGRIVSSDTGSPVRRAQVRITGPEITAKTAMTDAEGRYEFKDLPSGRYNLSASKAGYVQVSFGQTRPFESGKPVDMADAQLLDRADISMPRGSVIGGRILDEFGDPVADALVSAMRSSWSNGKRRLQATGRTAQTNDLGQYRIYGLPPGDYYVSASLRAGGMEMAAMEMAMSMGAGGAVAARGPSGSNPNSGYAPTYFPGTVSGAEAQKIAIAVGQEAQGTDFALLPVRLAKITGTVIGSDGKPSEGVMVNAAPKSPDGSGILIPNTGRTDKNGNFTLTNVSPGDYTLQTRGIQIVTSDGGNNMVFTARVTIGGGPEGSGEAEFGSLPLSVSGEDISNVIVVTTKGTTATGRLVYDGGAKPNTTSQVRIIAQPLDNDNPMFGGGMGATAKEDGSFEIKGLAGHRMIRAGNLPPGWLLKAITVNGLDITDTGMDFKPGDVVSGVEIVLTQKTTEIAGTVKAGNDVAKDYTLVVFSDEPARWSYPNSRYVTGVRPDTEGRFQVKNLPPGGYYAVAVEYIPQGEWGDPDVLDRLKANATRVSITEGSTKTLDLKLQ